ncbi:MAG: arylesterase [Acidobacteriota bacterium]
MTSVQQMLLVALVASLAGCEASKDAAARSAPEAAASPLPTTEPTTVSAATDTRKVIVVVGDSISAGYGLNRGQSFPDDLQRKLDEAKKPWRVVNQGISGDTTAGGASRIAVTLNAMPNVVLLELGGNDGLRGMPWASTKENLEKMIQTYQKAGAQVVLAGMSLPPNYGADYIKRFEQTYKELAAKYKIKLIPFLFSDMITPDLRYFQPDGIHPTAEGAEIVAGTVMKALEPLLK